MFYFAHGEMRNSFLRERKRNVEERAQLVNLSSLNLLWIMLPYLERLKRRLVFDASKLLSKDPKRAMILYYHINLLIFALSSLSTSNKNLCHSKMSHREAKVD